MAAVLRLDADGRNNPTNIQHEFSDIGHVEVIDLSSKICSFFILSHWKLAASDVHIQAPLDLYQVLVGDLQPLFDLRLQAGALPPMVQAVMVPLGELLKLLEMPQPVSADNLGKLRIALNAIKEIMQGSDLLAKGLATLVPGKALLAAALQRLNWEEGSTHPCTHGHCLGCSGMHGAFCHTSRGFSVQHFLRRHAHCLPVVQVRRPGN